MDAIACGHLRPYLMQRGGHPSPRRVHEQEELNILLKTKLKLNHIIQIEMGYSDVQYCWANKNYKR